VGKPLATMPCPQLAATAISEVVDQGTGI
jgi:hypothetical protein